ncbi:hypothetical protein HU200_030665 [Digitaria exilis]|uniref:Uncharacterized protein n=1 Tax=Digitaria exilis TaxID=1010633 RepID=A0A835BRL8_9POAL|nr:hypothetical protein HU200_030665 [Digitaria exilis]
MVSRIHPSTETTPRRRAGDDAGRAPPPSSLAAALRYYTVWKRSSMGFQGTDGFSVYDAAGALVFRVDNYSRRRKIFAGELLLMDGQGSPLLALRPQVMKQKCPCQDVALHRTIVAIVQASGLKAASGEEAARSAAVMAKRWPG